jgi:integral membrane sensor domain MASE1
MRERSSSWMCRNFAHFVRVKNFKQMKQKIAFALIMGSITTAIISFTLIYLNIGFTEKFWKIFLKSWVIAYLMVIPVILIIGPIIQKLVDKVFDGK